MIPLQNNMLAFVQRFSNPEGLKYPEDNDQFATVLETAVLPEGDFVEVKEDNVEINKLAVTVKDSDESEDTVNDIGETKKLNEVVLTSGMFVPETKPEGSSDSVADEREVCVSYDKLGLNVTDHPRKLNVKLPETSKDLKTSVEVVTGDALSLGVNSIVYSDKSLVTYKTDTFEGGVTLPTSDSSQPSLTLQEEPFNLEGTDIDNLVQVTKAPDLEALSKGVAKDTVKRSLLNTTVVENAGLDIKPQQMSEVFVSGSSPVTKELSFKQKNDEIGEYNLPLSMEEPIVLKEASSVEGGSTFAGDHTSDQEELTEPVELVTEDESSVDFRSVPKPNIMMNESQNSLEKTIKISETGTIRQMYEAIADTYEGLKPNESKTLTVTLTPEELGSVHVELQADEVGNIRAVLSLEKPETFKLFQQDVEQLKAVLKEIGIEESNVNLQLLADQGGGQKQSEYVAWEERESLLARNPGHKEVTSEMPVYSLERKSSKHLDIRA